MPRNKMTDLNNHMFEQLERLNDESLSGEKLTSEIQRSKAMCGIAGRIIDNNRLAKDVLELQAEYGLDTNDQELLAIGDQNAKK